MRKLTFMASFFLCQSYSAYALDVGDITSFMYSNTNKISKEIKNNSNSGRFVRVEIVRISSPLPTGEVIEMSNPDELLFTPANMLLSAKGDNLVTFIYNGPKDDQERYYRLRWTEESLSSRNPNPAKKSASVSTTIQLQTILVVSPRQENFSYHYADGKLTNNGNAAYKIDAYGTCLDKSKKENCKEDYFALPGQRWSFKLVDVENPASHISIWHNNSYTKVK
ncbi:EcpB family pilus assembly chaperone [Yersinia mollaretii]|uniref:EcpB family pilus assembly chaperone n=1 Tax=Yersinia mollaretii TaxID=33060 RepID=UPI0011AACFB6|nr:hypothetical protein [Yersinia mollaretii]